MERTSKLFVSVLVILIVGIVFALLYNLFVPAYTYQNKVHSHMENAYYANSPELMKEELELAISGMRDLGLTEDMYSTVWPWEKTPDRRMDYQYKHLQGIIERIDAVIEWKDKTYGNGSQSTEQLGDVYEVKMDNIRAFLQEGGWSDDIAQEAYYVNFHLEIHLFWLWFVVPLIVLLIFLIIWAWLNGDL